VRAAAVAGIRSCAARVAAHGLVAGIRCRDRVGSDRELVASVRVGPRMFLELEEDDAGEGEGDAGEGAEGEALVEEDDGEGNREHGGG
jgi:hypothetical protein